ncbi:MAG TPA: glycoside hydrolase family 3 N-terminal domain-containing protein [bacterium]|nr:glycoside hydrolase family 3 N-terminal domain-containing protein [bacterium]
MNEQVEQRQRATEKLIASMSMEQLVGQLLVTGFEGVEAPQLLKDHIRNHLVGGVILFRRNIFDADQTQYLTRSLQETASGAGEELPMLIMIDQEGGRVTRFDFAGRLPSAMALGAAGSRSYTYIAGQSCGKVLCALGINVNCAPVLDVLTNSKNTCIGTRSFGSDPERVAELGAQYINGLQSADVMAVAKHFPGLGAASFDTHLGPARVDKTVDELLECDLKPFEEAFRYGVAMVMATHAEYPKLPRDGELPASLSPYILTDLLRGRLDFRGPAVTDDLSMGAVAGRYGLAEAAVQAITAGADLLLFCHNLDEIEAVHSAIMSAIIGGELPSERVLEAAIRVLWLRAELKDRSARAAKAPSLSLDDLGPDMQELMFHEIAENAICVVKDEKGLLPVDADSSVLVVLPGLERLFNLQSSQKLRSLRDAMLDYFETVSEAIYDLDSPSSGQVNDVLRKANAADVVVFCTFSAGSHPRQLALGKKVSLLDKPRILVALDEPFDLSLLKGFGTTIAAFGFAEPTFRALASIIAGESSPGGRMPVEI